jgi:hypothetical protein
MAEEYKASDSYESDSIKDLDVKRKISFRTTGIPGFTVQYNQMNTYSKLKPFEAVKVSDAQIAMQCSLTQYLILSKIFFTFIFLVGLGQRRFLLLLPFLLFEFSGILGSLNLKRIFNLLFIVYLVLSILFRILSSGYFLIQVDFEQSCFTEKIQSFDNSCTVAGKYLIGSLFFIVLEIFQVLLTIRINRVVLKLSEQRIKELGFVLIAGKIPRFICCAKLKAWKITQG